MDEGRAESVGSEHVALRDGRVSLSAQAQMLVNMRDMLYDGLWSDFERDLRDRMADRPHVFEMTPPSEDMKETIRFHLSLIDELRDWEAAHQSVLKAKPGKK